VDAVDQDTQVSDYFGKWVGERFSPSHQHIVVASMKVTRASGHSSPQATFYAISLGGIANFLGYGETNPRHGIGRGHGLQPKRRTPGAIAPGGPLKL
jgi:hypothetical protein